MLAFIIFYFIALPVILDLFFKRAGAGDAAATKTKDQTSYEKAKESFKWR